MRDSLTTDNVRDFTQRYKGTFGWLLGEKGTRTLVQVTAVNEERVKFVDLQGGEYFASANKGVEFEFMPVTRGLYNTSDMTVFVARIAARQWHRGICAQNTCMFMVNHKYGLEPIPVDIKNVNALFNSKVDVNKKLASFLKDSSNAVALNRHFALVGDMVLFMDKSIGSITGDKITLSNGMFQQELSDVIRRNKFQLSIQ